MDSRRGEEEEEVRNNTDDTLAWNKKRGRRVSFAAEMTSVHVFDRDDDDLETPPEPPAAATHESAAAPDDVPSFFKDLEDSDDGEEDETDRQQQHQQPFLQPFESPSPASAFGSAATSNDDEDDDFFGPVSSKFIRPGRLSDSLVSDDNHEVTMDSTAFSMHYRSLAKSESGDLETPTASRLVFEEKTPTQTGTTIMQGSSMELTRYDKSVPHASVPVDKFSSGKDSNDMSLVEENPRKYDYATISPGLGELMSVGNKFPGISTSEFYGGINATNYSEKNSSSTMDAPAADLGSTSVDMAATAYDGVREEQMTNSHSLVQPRENKNQSTTLHNTATGIAEYLDLNHAEGQMASIGSDKLSELSSPVLSFSLLNQNEQRNFHFRDDLLKLSETAPKSATSDQKCPSHSPIIPCPPSSVKLSEDNHGEGRHGSVTSHSIAKTNQSPSVAITSLVYGLKVELAVDVSNSSELPKLIPSEKSDGSLLNKPGTNADLRYSSEKKLLPGPKLNGVASLSCTPVARDSSVRSKLSSCIVKTPQRDIPISRLEDQFLGTEQGITVQNMTQDVDGDEFMLSEKLGGSLLKQEGIDTDARYASRIQNITGLKCDGVSSLNVTPLVEASSIRSKLSSCIVKTPQHGMLVSRLEERFSSIDQEHRVQKRTADVGANELMNTVDGKELPNNVLIKSMETRGISSQLTAHVEEVPHHLSTLKELSKGTAITSGNKSLSSSSTHNGNSQKKMSRTPVVRLDSQCQSLVSGMSPRLHHCSPDELHSSLRRLSHDVLQSYHTIPDPLSLADNKSDDIINKVLPSQKNSYLKSPSRYGDICHLELNQRIHADKAIETSPEEEGDLMEIISSGSRLNVVARNLDNMFIEQNLCSRSPVILIDKVSSPFQVQSLLNGESHGLLHSIGFLPTPLKTEAIMSSDGNLDPSGLPHAHASAVKSLITVQTATKESSPSAIEKYLTSQVQTATKESSPSAIEKYETHLKAPQSSVPKRGHDQIVTGNEHSAPHVDKLRSPKIPKKEVVECVKFNNCRDVEQSSCGSIAAPKHWSALCSKALADSEQWCSTSFGRLDIQKVKLLEDVLTQLQKVHTVTGICDRIQTQSFGNHYNMERNRSICETKELLRKILYEKAKLKLISAKKEKLLQREEIVRSGIHRCQTMKLNCFQLCACHKCNAESGHCNPQSLTARFEDQQNVQVVQMRQKVGATKREIDSLMCSFHTCFKMKEKSSDVDTIMLINDRLKRRALCKALRDDVQLWKIDDMVYKKGQNKISLNYHGFLIQRFTLAAPISTVTVSYMLNHSNIEKKYPNMDAHIAFTYVFKVDVEQKYVGIRSLAQETQVTSSILSSLLDVVEEVKLARLELKHLKEARFLSSSAGKLDLCLHFVDFKTGMKVETTLDVSCLSCGVYPSGVFPSHLQQCHPLLTTGFLLAGLEAAMENLELGFSRILRVCRCISKLLASPS